MLHNHSCREKKLISLLASSLHSKQIACFQDKWKNGNQKNPDKCLLSRCNTGRCETQTYYYSLLGLLYWELHPCHSLWSMCPEVGWLCMRLSTIRQTYDGKWLVPPVKAPSPLELGTNWCFWSGSQQTQIEVKLHFRNQLKDTRTWALKKNHLLT